MCGPDGGATTVAIADGVFAAAKGDPDMGAALRRVARLDAGRRQRLAPLN